MGCAAEVVTRYNMGRQCIWAELHETGGRFLPTLAAVNRLGCRRAVRRSLALPVDLFLLLSTIYEAGTMDVVVLSPRAAV